MSTQMSSRNECERNAEDKDHGFTLVEILIAIVLVGILSAVAVVGISNLVSKGTSSTCAASLDASKAASAVYFASNGSYPTSFTQLTTGSGGVAAALTLPSGATINSATSVAPALPTGVAAGLQVSSGKWYLSMTVSGAAAPTFSCAQ